MSSWTVRGKRQRGPHLLRVPMLAGWLFADLFLVLFVVVIAAQPSVSTATSKAAHPIGNPAHQLPAQLALDRRPVEIDVNVAPADLIDPALQAQAARQLLHSLKAALTARKLSGLQAGFVLVFASGTEAKINSAIASANAAIQLIRSRDQATFGGAGAEGLWRGHGDYFEFQIFFFAA